MKFFIVRTPLAVAALAGLVLAAGLGGSPAALAEPAPSPAPIFNLGTPPRSVAAPDAANACANDTFLAYRAVPQPWEREVTICGTAIAALAGQTRGGPAAAFAVVVDGTTPIAVVGAPLANAGDSAVVRGRYHRDKSGAEWIDRVTQAVSRDWSRPGFVILNGTTYQ